MGAVSALALLLAAAQTAAAPSPSPRPRPSPIPPPALEGRVLGPDSKPVPDALVVARDEKASWTEAVASGRTDREGRFRLILKQRRPHLVWAQAPGFAIARRESVPPGEPLTLRVVKGGTITGTVRDADSGAPLEGVEVEASVWESRPDWEPDAGRLRTVTDREGRFRIDGVDKRAHVVSAAARGYAEAYQQGVLAGREVTLYLQPGASVGGVVVDAEGRPAAGAVVHLSRTNRGSSADVRAADRRGAFVFPGVEPGSYTLLARLPDVGIGVSPGVEVAEAEVRRDVILLPAASVVGRLVDPDGAPVAGRVQLAELAGEPAPLAAIRLLTAEAGADGRFRIDGLPLGPAALAARAAGFAPRRIEIDARPGPPADLGDTVLEAGLRTTGRVRSKDGSPIADARLACVQRTASRESNEATSQADGRFVLGGLAPGLCWLSVEAAGFARLRMQVAAGSQDVDVVMAQAGRVTGLVVGEDGAAVASYRVHLERGDFEADREEDVAADDGRFIVEDAAEGTFTLQVTAPERAPAVVSDVVVRAGRTTDVGRVRLQRGGSVRGQVVGPDDLPIVGATVRSELPQSLYMYYGDETTVMTDASGVFELRGLKPGKLDVVAEHPRYATGRARDVEIDPARTADVRIRLTQGGRIEGTARHRNGSPMAGAQIRVWGQSPGMPSMRTANVAADGAFAVDRVAPGPVTVNLMETASGRTYGVASKQVEVREGETAGVDLVVASILVSGRVTRGGSPLPGVRVWLRGPTEGFFYTSSPGSVESPSGPQRGYGVSDENGRYELLASGAGVANVSVELGDPPVTRRFTGIEIPDADSHELDLELGGAVVAGSVVDAADKSPIVGAQVTFRLKNSAGDSFFAASTTTAPDGRFRGEVTAGRYAVDAGKEGFAAESIETTASGTDPAELSFALDRGVEIRGRVLDAEGRPFAGATVYAGELADAQSMADGTFRLRGLKEGSYDLVAEAEGRGFARRSPVPAPSDGVVLQLAPGGRVGLVVRKPDGLPAAGVGVWASKVDGVASDIGWARTSEDGRAEIEVPAGEVNVVADTTPASPPLRAEGVVRVKAGETATLELTLGLVPKKE